MASNTPLNVGTGPSKAVTKEVTHDGDAGILLPGSFIACITGGSEGSYTAEDVRGDTANGLDVDVTRSALPTGAATSAKQDTIIGHVDGVEALLVTGNADTANIATNTLGTAVNTSTIAASTTTIATQTTAAATSLAALDNAIAGNELQVDIVSGTVTANAGTNLNTSTLALEAGGNLAAAATYLSTLAGTVSASEVQVSIGSSIPLDITAGDAEVEIGAVDGVRVFVFGSGGTQLTTFPVSNAGTFVVQVDGAALTALQLLDNTIIVDDAAFTPGTTSVSMVGFQADETATDSVNEGDGGAARMTLDRKIIVNAQPHTAGGLSVFRSLDLDETEEDVKTSPGCLYKLRITNRTTSVRYVRLYNDTAANVIVGTTAPLDTIPIPGNASDYTVLTESFGGLGLEFSVALSLAATTGFADNDTGAPGANDLIVSAYYK
jgi:hypothetical protein